MRLAWFSPLPPHRSGIAAYSADVLPALARHHQIDAFVDDAEGAGGADAAHAIPGVTVRGAYDFSWTHAQRPFDVIVYQLGNDRCHDYMWPYFLSNPGLIVMHDAQLHQARARALLRQGREEDYVKEFLYSHEGVGEGVPRMVAVGIGGAFYYLWPMLRVPGEAARLLAVHNTWLVTHLTELFPGTPVTQIRMGVPDPLPSATIPPAVLRQRHGIPESDVVFAAFGRVTPEKGFPKVLAALAQLGTEVARASLLCVGETADYYDILTEAREAGIGNRVRITGYVPDEDLPSYLTLADVCLCLRWPTARETSASWLRCVAAGRPTIVNDLIHTGDVPALDPRSMTVRAFGSGTRPDPIAVGIDLLDENNTLRLALRRLTGDAALRQRLGDAARRYWAAHATMDIMLGDYERALTLALSVPAPPHRTGWPAHLTVDGTEKARAVVAAAGLEEAARPRLADLLDRARRHQPDSAAGRQ